MRGVGGRVGPVVCTEARGTKFCSRVNPPTAPRPLSPSTARMPPNASALWLPPATDAGRLAVDVAVALTAVDGAARDAAQEQVRELLMFRAGRWLDLGVARHG